MPDDRDRPTHLPPAKPDDREGAGPEFTLDREPATPGHAIPACHRQLHGFPIRQIETAARGDARVGPERLDGSSGRRPLPRRDPCRRFGGPPRQPSAGELGRTDQQDLIFDEGLGLDLRRRREPADHPELGTMCAQRLHHLRRRPPLDAYTHGGMLTLERHHDLRYEVRGGHAGRSDHQRAGTPLPELDDAPCGLGQKRLGTEHMIGEELSGRRQVAAPGSALDQLRPDLSLHVRDVLGHCGLTNAELPRGRRERAASREGRERPQPSFQLHNQRLYGYGLVCISVLPARRPSLRLNVTGRAHESTTG